MRRLIFEPGPTRLDAGALQALNTKSVLTAIASRPGGTAADAGRATGLSASTVSRLVEDLKARNLVLEGDRVRGKRGQPGVSLRLNPEGAFSAGCQIGFGDCHLLIRSLGGQVAAETAFSISEGTQDHVAQAVASAFGILGRQLEPIGGPMMGIGIAVPADFGRLFGSIRGRQPDPWDERAFRLALQKEVGLPVTTYALGTAGARAELAAMRPPRPADYLYLFVDEFIQSGLMLDGRLWMPPLSGQGAIGRVVVGAAERRRSLYDVMAGQHGNQRAAGWPATRSEGADRWLADAAEVLAQAVQSITDTLGLSLVVIDGNVSSDVLDALLHGLDAHLAGVVWASAPELRRGLAGARGPANGAALIPLYAELFADVTG